MKPKATVLLVEDNDDQAELITRKLMENRHNGSVRRMCDGEEALEYLFRRGAYADAELSPRPNLILLDLRLPKVDGLDVLGQIKANDEMQDIPVVILTTSAAERDIVQSYRLHANSYLVKPLDFKKFEEMMHSLGAYWLAMNFQLDSDLE
jgi:CheY-like chemotaxis protein